jgi:RNA polymerase sigma factor for flagellar operon FliA
MEQNVNDLWDVYLKSKEAGTPDHEVEKMLVNYYYPLTVRKVANRMHQKHTQLTREEIESMGVDGLYDAVRGFKREYQAKFETYAMHRIRGSVLDEIRKADWIPRLVRSKSAWMERQRSVLESRAGYRLSSAEMAQRLGKPNEEFEVIVKASATPTMHSVNETNNAEKDSSRNSSLEQAPDTKIVQPLDRIMRKEIFTKLMGKNFTPFERKIIWLYYFEDRSMKEISAIVKLSESRVSQMHGDIMQRLKQKADRNPEYFADIWELVGKFKGLQ